MALTVEDYLARMKQAIGNADPSTGFTLLEILNESLRELYNWTDWNWRKGTGTVDFVASQNYAALPADFGTGRLLSVESTFQPTTQIIATTVEDIARMRGQIAITPMVTWVAVSWPSQSNSTSAPGQAILELWPTPAGNKTAAIRIVYQRGPAVLTSDVQVPNIPVNFEAALSSLARANAMLAEFGASSEEAQNEMALTTARLSRLMDADGSQQQDLGIIEGAVACYDDSTIHFDPTTAISNRS